MATTRDLRSRTMRLAKAAAAASVGVLALTTGLGTATAGDLPVEPQASVTTECLDQGEFLSAVDAGLILVTIVDDSSERYDVTIDGVVVAAEITDTDGAPMPFGPYADGTHTVSVFWRDGETTILDTEVDIECAPVPTTLAPTTTEAPTTTAAPTTAAPTTTLADSGAATTTTAAPTTAPTTTLAASAAVTTTTRAPALPATGADTATATAVLAITALAVGSLALLLATRRRST